MFWLIQKESDEMRHELIWRLAQTAGAQSPRIECQARYEGTARRENLLGTPIPCRALRITMSSVSLRTANVRPPDNGLLR